jgi:hypothetical protein
LLFPWNNYSIISIAVAVFNFILAFSINFIIQLISLINFSVAQIAASYNISNKGYHRSSFLIIFKNIICTGRLAAVFLI